MLKIENLSVKLKDSDKAIINNLSLDINDGEIHAIMGPNGTGKSTLAKTIMGYYKFEITDGNINYNGTNINNLEVDERAKLGIFLGMQDPTEIEGVTTAEFLKTALNEKDNSKTSYYELINSFNTALSELSLSNEVLHRSINKGFSGGEKKKLEVFQIKTLKPSLIILDEIDSGLDVDSLKIVASNINDYIKTNPKTSVLVITHHKTILDYIKPEFVHVMNNGTIIKTGDYNLALQIEENGYKDENN